MPASFARASTPYPRSRPAPFPIPMTPFSQSPATTVYHSSESYFASDELSLLKESQFTISAFRLPSPIQSTPASSETFCFSSYAASGHFEARTQHDSCFVLYSDRVRTSYNGTHSTRPQLLRSDGPQWIVAGESRSGRRNTREKENTTHGRGFAATKLAATTRNVIKEANQSSTSAEPSFVKIRGYKPAHGEALREQEKRMRERTFRGSCDKLRMKMENALKLWIKRCKRRVRQMLQPDWRSPVQLRPGECFWAR